MKNKKQFLSVLISVLVCVFIVGLAVYGATTIGDSIVVGSDGTAATPAINFADDTNTGIYRIGADNIGFAVLATRAFSIIGNTTSPIIIGGYSGNTVASNAYGAAILSGGASDWINSIGSKERYSVIVGGRDNTISSGIYATGTNFIGGGYTNSITGGAFCYHSVIVGGQGNTIIGSASYDFIGGGNNNTINATMMANDVIGGGYGNTITGNGWGTIAGGQNNSADHYAFIGGGGSNTASGTASMIPGGYYNIASGTRSWAAGRQAEAIHQGAFVWADDHAVSFESGLAHEVAFRAGGGMRIVVDGANDLFRVFDDTDEVFTILDGGTASISQDLWASGSFQFGGGEGIATASYSRLGSTDTGHSLADSDDLMVSGNMEVDGTVYFDGTVSVSESNGIMFGGGARIFGGTASPQGSTLNCTAGSIYIHAGASGVDDTIAVCETTNSWQWADL